ncbi:MAG: hypothetical protein PHE49_09030 [bacterium]|nr:hypothetical protein [bacterium]
MKLKMILSLTIVCLVSAFSLAGIYQITNTKIEKDKAGRLEFNLLEAMFPGVKSFLPTNKPGFYTLSETSGITKTVSLKPLIPDTVWGIYANDNQMTGIVFKISQYKFGKTVETYVALGNDTVIKGITTVEGLGTGTKSNDSWLSQFINKKETDILLKKDGGTIEVAPSTAMSVRVMINSIRENINTYKYLLETKQITETKVIETSRQDSL